MDKKWCEDCQEDKPLSDFTVKVDRNNRKYPHRYCKVHSALRKRVYYQENKDRIRLSNWGHQLKAYGITPEDWESMYDAQGGKCAICRSEDIARKGHHRFHTDHDHVTGQVRGLLCASCNTGLGRFKDDPDLLRAAIDYLESSRVRL